MRKELIFCLSLLFGCGSNNCKGSEPPTVPTVVPTVTMEPDAGPAPSSEPEPKPEGIDWKTPEQIQVVGTAYEELCLFAYFPSLDSNSNTHLEEVLQDEDVVKEVNKHFIALRFPIDADNKEFVMEQFELEKLPTLMMVPSSDMLVLQVEGNVPADKLVETIKTATKEGELLFGCNSAKEKVKF